MLREKLSLLLLVVFCFFFNYNLSAQSTYTKEYHFTPPRTIQSARLAAQSVISAGDEKSIAIYNVLGDRSGSQIYVTVVDPDGVPINTSNIGSTDADVYCNSIIDAGEGEFLIVGKYVHHNWQAHISKGIYVVRINALGVMLSDEIISFANVEMEGINIIRANNSSDEYIITGTSRHNDRDQLLLLKIQSTSSGTSVLWNQFYTYNFVDGCSDVLPTSIVATGEEYIVVGQHVYTHPAVEDRYSVFAIKINESGVLQGSFNTYYLNDNGAGDHSFKPGVRYVTEDKTTVLVYGSSVPSPFPHTWGPDPSCTIIGAGIGLDEFFVQKWARYYWTKNVSEMLWHTVYKGYPSQSSMGLRPRCFLTGVAKRTHNGKYSPITSKIYTSDGKINHYVAGYDDARNVFSPYCMKEDSDTYPYQFIGTNLSDEYGAEFDLIRLNDGGNGKCVYTETHGDVEVISTRTIYDYDRETLNLSVSSPELYLQLSYETLEDPCQ